MNSQVTAECILLTTEEPSTHIVFCDTHHKFGTVYLARRGDYYHANVNGAVWRTWRKQEWPIACRVKWFEGDKVLVWPADEGAILLSSDDTKPLQYGTPFDIFVTENYVYVTYGEEAIMASSRDDPEFNIISAYSKTGQQVLGLAKLIDRVPYSGILLEVSQACPLEDALVFLAYQTPHIWRLDAASRSVSCISAPSDLGRAIAISVLDQLLCVLKTAITGEHYVEVFSLASMNAMKLGEIEVLELNTFNPSQIRGVAGGMFLLWKQAAVALLKVEVSK